MQRLQNQNHSSLVCAASYRSIRSEINKEVKASRLDWPLDKTFSLGLFLVILASTLTSWHSLKAKFKTQNFYLHLGLTVSISTPKVRILSVWGFGLSLNLRMENLISIEKMTGKSMENLHEKLTEHLYNYGTILKEQLQKCIAKLYEKKLQNNLWQKSHKKNYQFWFCLMGNFTRKMHRYSK